MITRSTRAPIRPGAPSITLALLAATSLLACEPDDSLGGDPAEAEASAGDPADWPGGRYAVRYQNARGETITAVLELPPGVERVPAVTVLHGSGGLFRPPPDPARFDPATGEYERQFREWSEIIGGEGYAAFFPASFYSRGTFDWNDHPLPGMDGEERLRMRVYDAVAAVDWLCRHPRIDCGRTALIGFSNGGSTLLLSQYAGLEGLPDFPELRLPPPERLPRLAVAYYPGCGLQGFIGLAEGDYRPRVPLVMFHGGDDELLDNCRTRARQTAAVGGRLEHQIYPGVGHGFDGYPDDPVESLAEADARWLTLARIRAAFALAPR